jgi:hypothetical protein
MRIVRENGAGRGERDGHCLRRRNNPRAYDLCVAVEILYCPT